MKLLKKIKPHYIYFSVVILSIVNTVLYSIAHDGWIAVMWLISVGVWLWIAFAEKDKGE